MPSWLLVGAWLSLGVVPQQDIGFEERFMSPIASASVAYMADIGVYATIADRLTVSGFIRPVKSNSVFRGAGIQHIRGADESIVGSLWSLQRINHML